MNKYLKLFIAGTIATIIVTGYNYLVGPLLGLPTLQRTRLMASIFHVGLAEGWLLNLATGIVFTFIYFKLFLPAIPNASRLLSGLVFGVFIFLFIQFIYSKFGGALPRPANYMETESFMKKLIFNSFIGNLLFGLIVALFVHNNHRVRE
jgi:hypothetical protein